MDISPINTTSKKQKKQNSNSSFILFSCDATQDLPLPGSGLGHIHHVGHQSEPLQPELGDVGLEQDVDLGARLLDALLHYRRVSAQTYS